MNLSVQASINECLINQEKKRSKNQGDYSQLLYLFHPKERKTDRHKLNFKTRHWVRFFKQENYHLTPLEEIIKTTLSGGCGSKKNGGCETYFSLKIDNKNLFFLHTHEGRPTSEVPYLEKQKDYLFAHLVWREKGELERILEERPRQFRKKWQDIKLKVKILSQWDHPSKLVPGYKENGRPRPSGEGVGWNSPDYWEIKNRSLAALAFTNGIVLGKVDVPLLDLDPNKKDKEGNYKIKQEWLRKSLIEGGKEWKKLLNKYRIPYYWKTATPGNCLVPIPYWLIGKMAGAKVFHQGTGQEIGDLLACGNLVALPVGGDKSRQLVITKWGRKSVKKHGEVGILNKRLLVGEIEEKVEEILSGVGLSLNRVWKVKQKKPRVRECLTENLTEKKEKNTERLRQIEVKLSGKLKTCLKDVWKIFYRDSQQKSGYFLVNDYQREREFNNLEVGNVVNILLVQGWKHAFLSKIL